MSLSDCTHTTTGGGGTQQSSMSVVRRAASDLVSSTIESAKQAATAAAKSAAEDDEAVDTEVEASGSDTAGNTIFFVCITAFLLTALGLGVWVWRRKVQSKNAADGKDRKPGGGLPLTNLATANSSQTTLPPYTAPAAGAGFDYTPQGAVPGSVLDRAASVSRHNRERDQEAAIDDEPPSTPFSPFAPFSPVSATHGPHTLQHSVSRASLNSHAPYKPSNLQHGVTLTPPSSGIQYDPDAAQSMGIHPNVLAQAETGASEDEIERRRARAQRRLEEQQRRDAGQYDDGRGSSSTSGGFRSMARSREVIR